LVEEKDKKVKELQDNVAAVNFSPSSRMGRRLMNRCKDLQKENEDIGQRASEGKVYCAITFIIVFLYCIVHLILHCITFKCISYSSISSRKSCPLFFSN